MAKTFAQYLIDSTLPAGMGITRQIDKGYLKELLTEVARKHPDDYGRTVMALKKLGDRFSTLEPVTMGLDEISVPNKEERDRIIQKYQKLVRGEKDEDRVIEHLGNLQKELAANDLNGTTDDASVMVRSSLTGKKTQLMKLRTSPGVVGGSGGGIVNEIIPKSYAEGVDPLHFWIGAAESRRNIATGQVNTAKPGEMNKVISNVLNTAVVSREDCGTKQGILLFARDDDVLDRYLARDEGAFKAGTLIDADTQQAMLRAGLGRILVRSPETCACSGGTVCSKCMGLRIGTARPWNVGDNAGVVTAGNISEPLQQMTLSAKHSTSFAKKETGLVGEPGFRLFVEQNKYYPNRKILCEVLGTVYRIRTAPQGGQIVTIRQTRPVPDRYIELARKNEQLKQHWDYHIPPNLKLAEGISEGVEVYPGLALSTGVDNLKDIARLRNLGFMRSASAQGMYDIYRNTGQKLDRRHFELLARNASPYVLLVKVPQGFPHSQGETIEYSALVEAVKALPKVSMSVDNALGKVLGDAVLDVSTGTEIDAPTQKYLKENGVDRVAVVQGLEVAAQLTPLTRVVNKSQDWVATLNHRGIKQALKDAASFGHSSNIHGYNPITAYAYGTEMGQSSDGRY